MPNRDGGEDTRNHPNRQVSRWHPSVGGGAVQGSQRASVPNGQVNVDPSPYGWSARHAREGMEHIPGSILNRGQVFEETVDHYGAGPFRTEHRAKVAALSLAGRDDDKLQQHRA
jgi:hypothetical protein